MKKIIILPLLFILIFCGCGKAEKAKPTLNDISFTADIEFDGKDYSLACEVDENLSFYALVLEPASIKGLEIFADNNVMKIEFMGISYQKELTDFPVGNVVNIITSAISDNGNLQDNIKHGKINNYDYTLSFDNNGFPKELNVPKLNLEIEFKDVQKNE